MKKKGSAVLRNLKEQCRCKLSQMNLSKKGIQKTNIDQPVECCRVALDIMYFQRNHQTFLPY